MGQTLSEPITEKHSSSDEDERIAYGASAMQGWRISMEDAHTTILKMGGPEAGKHISFFAVYDGHGGSNVARYSGQKVHGRVAQEEAYGKEDYAVALKAGFLGTDVDLRADENFQMDPSGCTAVAAIITDDWRIFVANAGDSRAVLSGNGTAVPLSFDHKPVNPEESQRIVAAGGFVEFGRVNGNLALSRAIGDFEFKQNSNLPPEQQIVTANPDVTERKLEDTDEFVVIACDGIWDCMSNQEVIDFVRQKIAEGTDLPQICEQLMDHCLAPDSELGGVGCDNMTVVIAALLKGKSKKEWAEGIAAKVPLANGVDGAAAGKGSVEKESTVSDAS
ncbi:phosphatase 2C-like domain-containing protein [Fimicolochytrium jonesii]|uniref:phosphatase 2C-like domain-containing protein n=1 Tax=Fimicolochytrium jonesii TaxID=1396493 RepID=UPI0022FE669B|nr:phosphatase 2C-like domain-containing protein [Fimicolochytrium jonesii]KAI8822612.1 phosphatase 2C-like domain-containing protein [Fimicolochytrium jonesii]